MSQIAPKNRVKNSLKYSVLDGSAYAAMLGLTQNYITPFALALKATTAQIGLLTSFPNFAMAISQMAAPDLAEKAGSRKAFILPVVFLHALTWIPMLLIPFFFHNSPVWWLIVFVTANMVLGALANPAWGSMMADLVPVRLRGRYFGVRGRITGFITVAFSLIAGFILQQFAGNVFIGFAILFGGAAVFRFISLYYLYRMWEPPVSREAENSTSLPRIILSTLSTNPGRFTLFVSLIFFASNVASPFFAVYMLRDLNYDYTDYTINITAYFVATIAFQTFWGRRGDHAGNLSVIRFTSYLLPAVPIVWLISTNQYFLIAAQVFSGFAWAGFNLAATNFLYDATEDGSRTKYIAFFNAMTGISICAGAVIGGYIIPLLPPTRGNNLLTLFLISGMLRGIFILALLNRIKEVRNVPQISNLQLLTGRFNNGSSGKITSYQAK